MPLRRFTKRKVNMQAAAPAPLVRCCVSLCFSILPCQQRTAKLVRLHCCDDGLSRFIRSSFRRINISSKSVPHFNPRRLR
ncbi:hypothetical protein D3C78_835660 [compost metagenome]